MEASESTGTPPPAAQAPPEAFVEAEPDAFAQRPEIYVGAAFAGGLAVAGLLRWIGR